MIQLFKTVTIIAVALLACWAEPSKADEYYFRPVNLASYQTWQPELEFQLSNPSNKPIWLKISVRQTGMLAALEPDEPVALRVFPTTVLMKPETIRLVTLDYLNKGRAGDLDNYEIIVEQLPIWFGLPGEPDTPEMMQIRRYTVEVKVRSGLNAGQMYAQGLSTADKAARTQPARLAPAASR